MDQPNTYLNITIKNTLKKFKLGTHIPANSTNKLYSRTILNEKIAKSNFPLFFDYFPAIKVQFFSILSDLFNYREKLEHDMLNSNF